MSPLTVLVTDILQNILFCV